MALSFILATNAAQAAATEPLEAEYGSPPSVPLEVTKAFMESQLKDPYSAQYILDRVYRGYCKKGWLKGKGLDWIGWAANIRINAKNSYGAYGGYEPYTVFFSGDSAVKAVEGANFGAYGPSKGVLGLDGGAGVCAVPKLTPEGSAPLDPNKPRLGIGFLAVPDGAYVGAVERGNVGDRSGIKVGIDVLPRLYHSGVESGSFMMVG